MNTPSSPRPLATTTLTPTAIVGESRVADESLAGHRVSFTGTLASMTHREAFEWVEKRGGIASESLSRQSTMLVVGEEGWPLEADGHPSVKLQQAQRLLAEGAELRIATESEWLGFIGLDDHFSRRSQIYTPATISQLLSINVHDVRRWERLGLIRAVRRVHRLPYFDLKQVASVQKLAQLVSAGVAIEKLKSSIQRLSQWVGDSGLALEQLELLSQGRELVHRDAQGRLRTVSGQRLLDFDILAQTPGTQNATKPCDENEEADTLRSKWGRLEWVDEGERRLSVGENQAAIEALRMSLMIDTDFPEVHFLLANVLYLEGHERAALERYYVAVELDRDYVEAWTQIGCLHASLSEHISAIDAFRIALDVHPDCAEAHFHKAESHWQLQQKDAARVHFQKYLEQDQRGPWADLARCRLETDGR